MAREETGSRRPAPTVSAFAIASRTKLRPRAIAALSSSPAASRAAIAAESAQPVPCTRRPRDALAAAATERHAGRCAREQVVGRAVAVPALHEHGVRAGLGARRYAPPPRAGARRDVEPAERLGLGQVRRDERRARDQRLDRHPDRAALEQRRAVARARIGSITRGGPAASRRGRAPRARSTSSVASMPSLTTPAAGRRAARAAARSTTTGTPAARGGPSSCPGSSAR